MGLLARAGVLLIGLLGFTGAGGADPGDSLPPADRGLSCPVVPACRGTWYVDVPAYGTWSSAASVLTGVRTHVDEHGYGWQSFYVDGDGAPFLRRLTVGGELAIEPGPIEWQYHHGGIPDEEALVVLERNGRLGGAYVLEPPSVFIDEGYERTFESADGPITVAFDGFEPGIVDGEPDGRCVQYRRGRLRFTTPDGVYVVGDASHLVTRQWVITVSAALRFVEGCIPAKFQPNVQYAIFRRAW